MNAESPLKGRQLPYDNPLANGLVVVVGVLAIALVFVVGLFAFLALVGVVIVLAAVIGVRAWWQGTASGIRKSGSTNGGGQPPEGDPGQVIEGEFVVVPERTKSPRRR
jgi:hypothetical protein